MGGSEAVELVSEKEMACLLAHHTLAESPAGFFFGMSDRKQMELIYFPGLCSECQEKENKAYERRLRNEHKQYILVPRLNGEPSIAQERKIILSEGKSRRESGF